MNQLQLLELLAQGVPLPGTLDALLRVIEEEAGEMLCTILLVDPDGVHMRHGAAPSMPQEYVAAIDGSAIGPNEGSCGTAAFRREPVIVEDIATDPLWSSYKQFALPHGLRACWSTPIISSSNELLGTPERHLRCNPVVAQFITHPDFAPVTVEGDFDRRLFDPADIVDRETLLTRGWLRLQELAELAQTVPLPYYPLPEFQKK